MKRYKDGSFILKFVVIYNGEKYSTDEEGKWWIENGKFHEYDNESGKTDIYSYETLNKRQIKFKSEQLGVSHETTPYEFIDTKK